MSRVDIMGAGVAGLAVAAALAEAGHDVRVFDIAEAQGPAQCSWWAGGMLAPHCERVTAEEAVVELGSEAADWWERRTGSVVRNGTLVVAPGRDRAELSRFARRTAAYEEIGAEAIAALEPDLAGRFDRALHFPTEAHLDPRRALAALAEGLRARGVGIRHGETPPGDGALTVDCRGFAASGDLPDLRGVKGEMLVVRSADIALSRPVRLVHPRHPLYVVPRGEGIFMLGATMIESADRRRITARSMMELLGAAHSLHPAFAEAEVLEIGVDVRPAFPDNLPRAEWRDGRLVVNGFYRHGFLLAPAMARRAAALVAAEERVA